jgi:hypothetical protein
MIFSLRFKVQGILGLGPGQRHGVFTLLIAMAKAATVLVCLCAAYHGWLRSHYL